MMFLFLALVWVLIELFLIVKVAELIGVLWMLVLLVASWPVGLRIMRYEGRTAIARLRAAAGSGTTPAAEVIQGALVLVGGTLFMIPGFLTDIVGAALLLPPARKLLARALVHSKRLAWLHRIAERIVTFGGGVFGARAPRGYDAEGSAQDISEKQLRDPREL